MKNAKNTNGFLLIFPVLPDWKIRQFHYLDKTLNRDIMLLSAHGASYYIDTRKGCWDSACGRDPRSSSRGRRCWEKSVSLNNRFQRTPDTLQGFSKLLPTPGIWLLPYPFSFFWSVRIRLPALVSGDIEAVDDWCQAYVSTSRNTIESPSTRPTQ